MKTHSIIGKLFFLTTMLCLPYQWAFSQIIQNDVIASGGNSYSFKDKEISWTLGESVTETIQDGNLLISQGFNQSYIIVLDISANASCPFHLIIFPNPAEDLVQIEFPESEVSEHYELTVYDINGKFLMSKHIYLEKRIEFDIRQYASGIILFNIERESDGNTYSYKIIKTD